LARHAEVETETPDYFELRARDLEAAQQERYRTNPPKDDDLLRHMAELRDSDLIRNFRIISATYKD
jgi:hypothetical protein